MFKNQIDMSVGFKIKKLREVKNISQLELAPF